MAEKTTNRLKPKREEIDLYIDDQFVELAEQSDEDIIEEEEDMPVTKAEKKKVVRDKKPKEEKEKKTKEKKEKAPSVFSQLIQFIRSERFKKISGLIFLLFTVFLTVSFASYLFTGADDRSTIYPFRWAIFFDATIKAGNHMGKLGAYISHLFLWNGYGLTAFLTLPFIFSYGVNRLLQKKIMPTVKIFKHCFALTIILAPAFTFIFQNKTFPYGGAFGIYINDILLSYLGQIGTGTLLSFSILGYLVAVFNFNFKRKEKQTAIYEDENSLQHSIVTVDKSNAFTIVPTQATPSFSETTNKKKEEFSNEIPLSNTFTADPIVSSQELELNQEVETEEPFNPDYDEDLELDIVETPVEEVAEEIENTPLGLYDPTLDLSNYKYPELDLLEVYSSEKIKIDTEELERNKNQIIGTLQNYGIEIHKIKATVGPTVTLYEIIPAPGVRISKIKNLEDDIALSLAALGIRIIAPIPGKGTTGIEGPNINKEVVSMRT
ncbi:MAG: DNA translocase FtsK 4TM domain-containing protein, partial [Bacteroidota bacterium]